MALKSYIFGYDYKAPCVVATGHPKNPQGIQFKQFRKGQIIQGELKHSNNKPAFVFHQGTFVIPLSVVKELVTKEIGHSAETKSNAPGDLSDFDQPKKPTVKIKMMDAAILGGLAGVLLVYVSEKQGWISEPDKKYKLYGAIGGAALGAYLIHRTSPKKPSVIRTKKN